jgi:hypothetical protein
MTSLEPLSHALYGLRDIEGTLGSFVVGTNGKLLASDAPSTISEGTLMAIAQRVPSLYRGFLLEIERARVRDLPVAEKEVADVSYHRNASDPGEPVDAGSKNDAGDEFVFSYAITVRD